MIKKETIKRFNSLLLLLIFMISSAPKAYFHDLLADHKDGPSCKMVHKTAVLHQQPYNCHFDDLVVTAPFVLQAEAIPVPVCNFFEEQVADFCSASLQFFHQHKENRGPPSIA